MNLRIIFTLLLITGIKSSLFSQVVTSTPAFPEENKSVTIYFNAAQGNGGLKGYTGDIYAHTGVITNKSTSSSDWKYVKTNWGVNTPETKLTKISTDYYKLEITPDIRSYYGVASGEKILKMSFVFRSGVQVSGQWLEGKTADFSDIFVDIFEPGLNVFFEKPSDYSLLLEINDKIFIKAVASSSDTIKLFLNGNMLKKVSGQSFIEDTIDATSNGKYICVVEAKNSVSKAYDTFTFYVRLAVNIASLPSGMADGINYLNDTTVTLVLYAPNKNYVFVQGSFSDWEFNNENYMNRTPDGNRYWVTLTNLKPAHEYTYQYYIDGQIRIADPYCEKVIDPWNDSYIDSKTYPKPISYPTGKAQGIVSVFQTKQTKYNWSTTSFNPPKVADMVVYELLIRDFTKEHNYKSLIDTLGYLKRLGVNVVEIMPVNEFEGNSSWGYNPSFYFAPDKYYGTKNMLKEFIDSCHKNGIAVVLDMVLNHSFGQSPLVRLYWDNVNNKPASNNPWFNTDPKHDFNVGYDFNHESQATKDFVDKVVKFWINEYKVDGYRFDLSKGFTQKNTLGNVAAWGNYDQSRIDLLKRMSDVIWSQNSKAYVILEHFANNDEEKVLANYGMLLWGNMNHAYSEASMGWVSGSNSDLSWSSYKNRSWNFPNLIAYMESHDEERMMVRTIKYGNGSGNYSVKDSATALKRAALAATFFFTIPGPKMIWQFGELGYDYHINYPGNLGGGSNRTDPKPPRWDYTQQVNRENLFKTYSALIKIKKEQDVFETSDFELNVSGAQKRIRLNHPNLTVIVIGNFDVVGANSYPNFPYPGKWYDYLNDDSVSVSNINDPVYLQAGDYRLYTSKRIGGKINMLTLSEKELTTEYTANSKDTFNITSNTNWTISSNQSWCVVSQTSGSGNKQIIVTVNSENTGLSSRTATLTIKANGVVDQTIKLTQKAKAALSVNTTNMTLEGAANSSSGLNITSNIAWQIQSNQSWCIASPSSGNGTSLSMIIATSKNESGSNRTAELTISGPGVSDIKVTVSQKSLPVGIIETENNTFNFYPNPITDMLIIETKDKKQFYEIQLLDISGKIVMSLQISGRETHSLNVDFLPSGIYLLKVSDNEGSVISKVIKE